MNECELREDFQELKEMVYAHEHLFRGHNSTPGVLQRLEATEGTVKGNKIMLADLSILMRGKRTNKDDVGLVGDVRDLKKMMTSINRLTWLLVSGVAGLIIQTFFQFITLK